jgi:hypothetical protein
MQRGGGRVKLYVVKREAGKFDVYLRRTRRSEQKVAPILGATRAEVDSQLLAKVRAMRGEVAEPLELGQSGPFRLRH